MRARSRPRTLTFGLLTLLLLTEMAVAAEPSRPTAGGATMGDTHYRRPDDAELRRRLSPLEYEVTQHAATEPAFRNRYWDNHAPGLYVDVVSGEPLFSSTEKFDSGTGWPSFKRPIEPGRVVTRSDQSHGMTRTEVASHEASSHLGHVFTDGPAPDGLRYCINSASLRFVPVDRLEAEGYGRYRALFDKAASHTPGRSGVRSRK